MATPQQPTDATGQPEPAGAPPAPPTAAGRRGPGDIIRLQTLTPRPPLTPGAGIRVYPLPHYRPLVPARWAVDPWGRHEWRWWNGIRWTDHVADQGELGIEPPGEPPPA
jgi:hypothetical protein